MAAGPEMVIEIERETEEGRGWTFFARVRRGTGPDRRHEIRLSWADYNLWSAGGVDEPARVAAAVLRFLASRQPPEEIRESFDASIVRRMYPEADGEIPGMI